MNSVNCRHVGVCCCVSGVGYKNQITLALTTQTTSMTKLAYLECPTGIAGDMCLGAIAGCSPRVPD